MHFNAFLIIMKKGYMLMHHMMRHNGNLIEILLFYILVHQMMPHNGNLIGEVVCELDGAEDGYFNDVVCFYFVWECLMMILIVLHKELKQFYLKEKELVIMM